MKTSRRSPFRSFLRRALRATAAATLVALAIGSAAAQATVTDALGQEVRLERPPERVIAMFPSHAESVCALTACDLLVGRDRHADHPPEVRDLPSLGDAFAPDLERLLALDPDLVLVDAYSGLAETVRRHGIPVYAGAPESVAGVAEVLRDLGALLHRPDEAEAEIARIEAALDDVRAQVAARPGAAPRVFLEIDPTPYTAGPNAYLGELLTLAGGANIVPEGAGDFPALDPEQVIRADPEIIVLLDAPYGESAETVAARPGWSDVAAVRLGAVIELTQEQADLLSRAGPRLPEAAALLARLVASAPVERADP